MKKSKINTLYISNQNWFLWVWIFIFHPPPHLDRFLLAFSVFQFSNCITFISLLLDAILLFIAMWVWFYVLKTYSIGLCHSFTASREREREEPSAASTTKTKPKKSTAKFYEANERALCVHSSMTRPMKFRINGMVWFRWKNEYQTRETFASWPFAFLFSLLAQFFHW